MQTLVVTGTRHGRDDVEASLDAYLDLFKRAYIIVGGSISDSGEYYQQGVDLQTTLWARKNGVHGTICYANWKDGKKAGPERNARMIAKCRRNQHLMAFPAKDSKGTWNCYHLGLEAGLTCVEVGERNWLQKLADSVPDSKNRQGTNAGGARLPWSQFSEEQHEERKKVM
jgi:hypothetical protein